jgi:small subunit ribosomal protein S16
MVVALRLQRFGNKNNPFYRLVAANSLSPRDGKCLERVIQTPLKSAFI